MIEERPVKRPSFVITLIGLCKSLFVLYYNIKLLEEVAVLEELLRIEKEYTDLCLEEMRFEREIDKVQVKIFALSKNPLLQEIKKDPEKYIKFIRPDKGEKPIYVTPEGREFVPGYLESGVIPKVYAMYLFPVEGQSFSAE